LSASSPGVWVPACAETTCGKILRKHNPHPRG
jgi:hypothetical protein